ncbi:unnamed protein product [Closterium sp. Naga37s-1]|nr:unnamed protein product [Closterium sp. Naga37s-1]
MESLARRRCLAWLLHASETASVASRLPSTPPLNRLIRVISSSINAPCFNSFNKRHILDIAKTSKAFENARLLSVASHSPTGSAAAAVGTDGHTGDTGKGGVRGLHFSSPHVRVFHASAPAAVLTGGATGGDTGKAGVRGPQPLQGSSEHAGEAGRSKLVEAFQIQAASDPMRGFMVALRKSELGFETGLALRDLRVVISALQNQIPTILIRPRAIVVSLAHVRAVITANRAYILNTSSPRVRQRLIPTLLRRLSASHAAAAAAGGAGGAGGGGGGGGDAGCDSCSPSSRPPSSSTASFSGSDSFFSGAVSVFSDCGGEPQGREVRGSEGGREQGGSEQKPLGRQEQQQGKQEREEGRQQELEQGQGRGEEQGQGRGEEQGQGQGQGREQWGSDVWGDGKGRCRESGRQVTGVCGRGEDDYGTRGHGERREEIFLEEEREERRGGDKRDDGTDGGRDDKREEEWCQGWQEEVSERRREEWRARKQREEERRRNKRWLEDLEKESKGRFSEASHGEEEEGEGAREHGDGHLIGSDGQWERYGEVLLLELTSKDGVPLMSVQPGQSDRPSHSVKPDLSSQKTHRGVVVRNGTEGQGVRREQAKWKGGGEGGWVESKEAVGSGGEASGRGVGEKALLDEVGVTLKVKYASIFPGVYQGLRAFAGGRVPYERAMAEQEAFLRAKNELLRLERSANQICNAVREVLSNDEDMAEMYLSRKASLTPGAANSAEHSEVEELLEDHLRRMEEVDMAEMYLSRKSALPPGTINSVEHSEVEELLEDHLRRMEEVDMAEMYLSRKSALPPGTTNSAEHSEVEELLEDHLWRMEEVMYLSRKGALPPGTANSAEHSEVEELLEDHLRRMEEVVGEAEQLLSMSDATSEYLRTALDRWVIDDNGVSGDRGVRVVWVALVEEEAEQLLSMSDATSEYLRTALDRWVRDDRGVSDRWDCTGQVGYDDNGGSYDDNGGGYDDNGGGYDDNGGGYDDNGGGYDDNGGGYDDNGVNDKRLVRVALGVKVEEEAEQLLSMSDATSEYLRTALDRWVRVAVGSDGGGLRMPLLAQIEEEAKSNCCPSSSCV